VISITVGSVDICVFWTVRALPSALSMHQKLRTVRTAVGTEPDLSGQLPVETVG
jgi:hypothetical protein